MFFKLFKQKLDTYSVDKSKNKKEKEREREGSSRKWENKRGGYSNPFISLPYPSAGKHNTSFFPLSVVRGNLEEEWKN